MTQSFMAGGIQQGPLGLTLAGFETKAAGFAVASIFIAYGVILNYISGINRKWDR